ncbi:neuropeptide F receptor [Anabrus simplex]|uniref:neuropeptide F receptor n=1 Tax=Anabrus simplex TaxID=316456 RepID=UPI0035A3AD2C
MGEEAGLPPHLQWWQPDMDHMRYHFQGNVSDYMRNVSWLLNATIDPALVHKYAKNRKIEEPAFHLLIAAYCVLIAMGATGNSLVVCAVVRKPAMRTARNMFIVNLAISDLLLCLITMPLTLMEILTKYWPLGRQSFICKMVGTLQATSIFVSSISITAIALDRYQVIVYPTRESLQKLGAVIILSCIWLVSLILASPMFIWKNLRHYELNLPNIDYVAFCLEEWPVEHGRAYYSVFSLVFQYVLPIITVTVAYSRICRKLRYRYVNSTLNKSKSSLSSSSTRRKPKDDKRMKRTNSLLVSIALIYCISWLPLNIFNLVVDLRNPFGDDIESLIISYAICHMMGMSSACSNPLLYGWLNDNFRKEFKEILSAMCPCIPVEAVRVRMGSLKSSVSRRRRRRHKAQVTGSSGQSAEDGAGGEGGVLVRRNKEDGDGGGGDIEDTVMAISNFRRGAETVTTTENGLGMMQTDTEMTVLTRA